MQLTKSELRKDLKARRLSLSEEERRVKSRSIVSRVFEAINWDQAGNVHIFEPIMELGEVDISGLNSYEFLFTSRKANGEWKVVPFHSDSVVPELFDVIIVPMLGFDDRLHRIGYGGGFYDKFLATQPNAIKIGVCFEIGKIEKIPNEPHDIALNLIITEEKTYKS